MTPSTTLVIDSPLGPLTLVADEHALLRLDFGRSAPASRKVGRVARQAAEELTEYFAGQRRRFGVRVEPHGTDFQRHVWAALQEIPWGETWSYAQLAKRVGNRNASRAVGAANGQNPIAILIPCHRVIGADGSLTGYAGGLDRKRWLLSHERSVSLPLFQAAWR